MKRFAQTTKSVMCLAPLQCFEPMKVQQKLNPIKSACWCWPLPL